MDVLHDKILQTDRFFFPRKSEEVKMKKMEVQKCLPITTGASESHRGRGIWWPKTN